MFAILLPFTSLPLLALSHFAAAPQEHTLYTFNGTPGARFGACVSPAGDVNVDGRRDVFVGAPNESSSQTFAGCARVYSGLDGRVLWSVEGDAAFDRLGSAATVVGDFDADGVDDLAVGAPGANLAGQAYIVSGASGVTLLTLSGAASGDEFGRALCGPGDVDGDGLPDLAVGARHDDTGGWNAGSVAMFSGADGSVVWRVDGSAFDQLGTALAGMGDMNGDGIGDVLVGVPFGDGAAFNGGAVRVLSGVDGALLLSYDGPGVGDQLGFAVARVLDVDFDGMDDIVAAAPGADCNGIDSGAAHFISGASGALLFEVCGETEAEYLSAVAGVGDLDGDGRGDALVGSASSDNAAVEAGRARVVSGFDGSTLLAFGGDGSYDWFGSAVAGVGDINTDGVPDFVVGAQGHDDMPEIAGYARVLSGAALSLAADSHALSASAGGVQALALDAGSALAGAVYLVVGSASVGAISIDGIELPLAIDAYTTLVIHAANSATYVDTFGQLDAEGNAAASISVPPTLFASLVGVSFHHAFVALGASAAVQFASNSAPLAFEP